MPFYQFFINVKLIISERRSECPSLGSKELHRTRDRDLRLRGWQGGRVVLFRGLHHLRPQEERRRVVGGGHERGHRSLPRQLRRSNIVKTCNLRFCKIGKFRDESLNIIIWYVFFSFLCQSFESMLIAFKNSNLYFNFVSLAMNRSIKIFINILYFGFNTPLHRLYLAYLDNPNLGMVVLALGHFLKCFLCAPLGYLYFFMNQDGVLQSSILAWLLHNFHLELDGQDSNSRAEFATH